MVFLYPHLKEKAGMMTMKERERQNEYERVQALEWKLKQMADPLPSEKIENGVERLKQFASLVEKLGGYDGVHVGTLKQFAFHLVRDGYSAVASNFVREIYRSYQTFWNDARRLEHATERMIGWVTLVSMVDDFDFDGQVSLLRHAYGNVGVPFPRALEEEVGARKAKAIEIERKGAARRRYEERENARLEREQAKREARIQATRDAAAKVAEERARRTTSASSAPRFPKGATIETKRAIALAAGFRLNGCVPGTTRELWQKKNPDPTAKEPLRIEISR